MTAKDTSTITHERLCESISYDPMTGYFTWLVTRGKARAGAVAGYSDRDGYIHITVFGKAYQAHRLAIMWMTGEFPANCVDHRDGCPGNNKWCNIRPATSGENQQNHKIHSDNTTGFTGVTFHKKCGKYQAQIRLNYRQHYLGLFETPEEAHAAYLTAKRSLHEFQPVMRK